MYSHMLSLSTKTSKALEKQHYSGTREQLGKKALWCYFYLSCEASWQITCNTTVVVLCCILRSCKTSSLVLTTSVVYIIHFQIHIWIVNTASCGAIKESFTILCTFLEMEFPREYFFSILGFFKLLYPIHIFTCIVVLKRKSDSVVWSNSQTDIHQSHKQILL